MTDSKLSRRQALIQAGAVPLATAVAIAEATPALADDDEYSRGEIVDAVSDFFGMTTAAVAKVVERVFSDLGRPNAYIKGEEGGAAIAVGLRYGDGYMYRKKYRSMKVYWQGPSLGFDLGANVSKCFTLVYRIRRQEEIFQRYPGVDGSYYFIAGIGVNYQRSGRISLAPMRTGLGLRAGVNVGYLSYSRERNILPF